MAYGLRVRNKNNVIILDNIDKIGRYIGGWFNQNEHLSLGGDDDPIGTQTGGENGTPPGDPDPVTGEYFNPANDNPGLSTYYDPKIFDSNWIAEPPGSGLGGGTFVIMSRGVGTNQNSFPPKARAWIEAGIYINTIKLTRQPIAAWRARFDLLVFSFR